MEKDNARPEEIRVNYGKLTEGIGIVFTGIRKMLDALEPNMTETTKNLDGMGAPAKAVEKPGNHMSDAAMPRAEAPDVKAVSGASGMSDNAAGASDASATHDAAEEATAGGGQGAGLGEGKGTSVTKDDITRIIVQKIKQDRSNNTKIGALLKAFGADKVSGLPEDQYEAFITELAQI